MSLEIYNLSIPDPFANDTATDSSGAGSSTHLIHIRTQQRNGRKSITTVEGLGGLGKSIDLKKVMRTLKKNLNCNGTIINHQEHGQIIQLQGDQRGQVKAFLEDENLCNSNQIKIHGA